MDGDTVLALVNHSIDQDAAIACYRAKQDQVRKRLEQ